MRSTCASRSHGRDVLLIDTAGIRRPPRVEGELEQPSVGRAIETIRRADVLLLVIDATEGITDQDARLAQLVDTNDRAMVLVCNKWDAAAKEGRKIAAFVRDAHHRFPFLEYATIVFTSALTGDGVNDIIPAALAAGDSWRATFQTSMLNRISRGDRRDGSADGRSRAAESDVCDANRQRAAAACDSSPISIATSPRTMSASSKRDFARRSTRRNAAANAVSPDRAVVGARQPAAANRGKPRNRPAPRSKPKPARA